MTDLLVSKISMVSSKECGRQVFFFPATFLFALFYLGVGKGKVHLRVQVRDGKGKTNTW